MTRKQLGNDVGSWPYWLSGRVDARTIEFGRTYFLVDGFEESTQSSLPLAGHAPLDASGIYRWISLALTDLAGKDASAFSFIQDWSRAIVWLRCTAPHAITELTSVSLPSVPFCTFLTKKAIRHIPPKTILPVVSLYGLQENLFHEALHQQLSASLLFRDLHSKSSLDDCPHIRIPWRSTCWPLDRAIHAAWVYGHLIAFRRAEVERGPEGGVRVHDMLLASLIEAQEAFSYLLGAIRRHRNLLTEFGTGVLDRLAGVRASPIAVPEAG